MCSISLQVDFSTLREHNSAIVFFNPDLNKQLFRRLAISGQIEAINQLDALLLTHLPIIVINQLQVLLVKVHLIWTQIFLDVLRHSFAGVPRDSLQPVHSGGDIRE